MPVPDGAAPAAPSVAEPLPAAAPLAVTEPAAVAESSPAAEVAPAAEAAPVAEASPVAEAAPVAGGAGRAIRRGLPRVPGGEPWPPASVAPAVAPPAAPVAAAPVVERARNERDETLRTTDALRPGEVLTATAPAPVAPAAAVAIAAADGAKPLRRGLPRVAGGEPWPPAGMAPAASAATVTDAAAAPVAETPASAPAEVAASVVPAEAPPRAPQVPATATGVPLSQPLPFTRTVWAGQAARTRPAAAAEPQRIGPFTRLQWAGAVLVGGAGLLIAAGMAVALVRWLLSTEWGVGFLAAYPGEYHLPEGAPVGFPAWLGWQHFFNVFLMVLIIRTGLQVRTEKRPSVFWSPRNNNRRKISLNLWFHQSLDILWLVNGVIFVVLLFVTGQWMRIVPTSWEVFPNAVSAALQYVSLDWPTENGWVNYNSLQQLAYFATVFLAAPLAALTGVRMSGIWPKNAAGLNKAYPVEWARAVHFPVMLYFVVFIAVHVFLVFATGALRNLNHMYAAQGSVDPNAYADNWTGFWLFVASLVVIAAAWVAARPLVLAPIARLFGKVSGR
ncbi:MULTISPECIES: cytochrome b/b6 domain-containing protein [Microbacterium]|uniref:cytochrome b/b6 domain-containing protein n=1 Tax=Microbacterium TaxID=33882 RepID=UPI00384FF890